MSNGIHDKNATGLSCHFSGKCKRTRNWIPLKMTKFIQLSPLYTSSFTNSFISNFSNYVSSNEACNSVAIQ